MLNVFLTTPEGIVMTACVLAIALTAVGLMVAIETTMYEGDDTFE